jgi:hypothetical protein
MSDILKNINSRIEKEYCHNTYNELSDKKLISTYKNCQSVKKRISELNQVLLNQNLNEETRNNILEDYILKLIPAGTKGVIRGNKFNKLVEKYIINLKLNTNRFNVSFEKKCDGYNTNEIPDWFILDKTTGRILIGMNQLDLWGGGQQLNRGSKYILNNKNNNENSKLLCVVCNKIQLKSKKNKVFNLFKVGFQNDTLCYLNNLQNIIYSYFNLQ